MKSLSICLVCSNPITLDFSLKECLMSVSNVANEIILVNGDNENNEVSNILNKISLEYGKHYNKVFEDKGVNLKIINIPWKYDTLKKNVYWILKSIAIGQATSDYVMRLDADEVLHEKDYDKIKQCLELSYDSYTFRTLHFWGDYNTLISGENPEDKGNKWYERRVYLFKNRLGYYENQNDIVDVDGNDLNPKHTSITVFHYGHAREKEAYIKKKNLLEKSYHDDWNELIDWNWETGCTLTKFEGTHPFVMEDRIKGEN